MAIERLENGPRFCRVLTLNGIAYLAGVMADNLSGDWCSRQRTRARRSTAIRAWQERTDQSS